jgi:hypothetical protein
MSAIPDQGKVCTKCGKWKYYDEFYRDRRSKSGRMASCKECNSVAFKLRWQQKGGEYNYRRKKKYLRTARARKLMQNCNFWYRAFNREMIQERDQKRYMENREKRLEQMEKVSQRIRDEAKKTTGATETLINFVTSLTPGKSRAGIKKA